MPFRGDDAEIDAEIRRGDYESAIRLLKEQIGRRPGNSRLIRKLAEVLVRAGHIQLGADIYCALAEAYAKDGFTAKAIATLKRVQRIDRRRPEAELRLAELILRRNREISERLERVASPAAKTLPVRSPLFDGIGAEELVAAIGGFELWTLGPGEVVFSEGEIGDSLYVLASGTANVFVKDEAGHNAKVRTLGDGDFFGEIALVTGGPRTATVTTAEECEVLRLERQTVESLVERFPEITRVVGAFAEMRSGSAEELEARLILPAAPGSAPSDG